MMEENKELITLSDIDKFDPELKRFFAGSDFIIEEFGKANTLTMEYNSTKLGIVNGVFSSVRVNNFYMITAGPSNIKDIGKMALVFNNHNLSSDEMLSFESMVYNFVPINIILECFIFNTEDLQKHIEHTNQLG
jgi:hypothetical protein